MAGFKLVISDPKSRKAYQREVDQAGLVGKKVGEKVAGSSIGLEGYTIEITGGSDREGFPMRRDVEGQGRKRLVLSHPPGFHPERKGQRKRKSVRGNTISQDIVQVNAKVLEYGKKGIEEIFGIKPKEAEKPKEKEGEKAEKKAEPEKAKEHPKKEEEGKAAKTGEKTTEDRTAKPERSSAEKAEEKMGVKKLED